MDSKTIKATKNFLIINYGLICINSMGFCGKNMKIK